MNQEPFLRPQARPSTPNQKPFYRQWWFYLILAGPFLFCCVGIGAAVAIPAFIQYVKTAKTQEARALLHSMAEGTVQFCRSSGTLPGVTGPEPEVPGSMKQTVRPLPGFAQIGFSPAAPVYYSYAILPTEAGIRLTAEGDLDGDGLRSVFAIHCDGTCTCGDLEESNPLE